jgi:hypothetical protein
MQKQSEKFPIAASSQTLERLAVTLLNNHRRARRVSAPQDFATSVSAGRSQRSRRSVPLKNNARV